MNDNNVTTASGATRRTVPCHPRVLHDSTIRKAMAAMVTCGLRTSSNNPNPGVTTNPRIANHSTFPHASASKTSGENMNRATARGDAPRRAAVNPDIAMAATSINARPYGTISKGIRGNNTHGGLYTWNTSPRMNACVAGENTLIQSVDMEIKASMLSLYHKLNRYASN